MSAFLPLLGLCILNSIEENQTLIKTNGRGELIKNRYINSIFTAATGIVSC